MTEVGPKPFSLTFLSFQLLYYGTRVTMCPICLGISLSKPFFSPQNKFVKGVIFYSSNWPSLDARWHLNCLMPCVSQTLKIHPDATWGLGRVRVRRTKQAQDHLIAPDQFGLLSTSRSLFCFETRWKMDVTLLKRLGNLLSINIAEAAVGVGQPFHLPLSVENNGL